MDFASNTIEPLADLLYVRSPIGVARFGCAIQSRFRLVDDGVDRICESALYDREQFRVVLNFLGCWYSDDVVHEYRVRVSNPSGTNNTILVTSEGRCRLLKCDELTMYGVDPIHERRA